MITIKVAGAGAGKTYELAEAIANRVQSREHSHKVIHAVTFTNAARDKIEQEVRRRFLGLPDGVQIQTVHAFLLNELIYPYSPFVHGTAYKSVTTVSLNPKYKANEIAKLKKMHIVHVDGTYAAARRVVDNSLSTLTVKKRKKIGRVLEIIVASTDKIFLDEAQDMDETALKVFEALGLHAIDVYMVGDPKQAIRYPSAFSDFLSRHQEASTAEILPFNNTSRRVPSEILNLSNRFCYPGQEQESITEVRGSLRFIESTHPNYDKFLSECKNAGYLVCIEQRTGRYETSSSTKQRFHPDIEELLRVNCGERDPDIFIEAEKLALDRRVADISATKAVSGFLKKHNIDYTPEIYGKIMQTFDAQEETGHIVPSIDAIKGLEAATCVLVLTPTMYKYLTQTGLSKSDQFNRNWKKIYVAITRAKREFVVALDHSLFEGSQFKTEEVRNALLEFEFEEMIDN